MTHTGAGLEGRALEAGGVACGRAIRGGGLMEERGGAEFWDGSARQALPLLMAGWVLEAGEKSVS